MRIVLPFWRGVPEKCFYQDFHQGIADALRELGHQASYLPFEAPGPFPAAGVGGLYRQLQDFKPDLLLDLACWGHGLSRIVLRTEASDAGEPILDKLRIPYAGWLFDQPCNQSIGEVVGKTVVALYPDLDHPEQVRLVYPALQLTGELFAPPAVRPANDHSVRSAPREIDVLYIGNLSMSALQRPWQRDTTLHGDAVIDRALCDRSADLALERPHLPVHACVRAALAERRTPPGVFYYAVHVSLVESFVRHVLRRDAVMALARAGVNLHVVGDGWQVLGLPANVTLHAPTDYDGMHRLAARAKICLDASTYLAGANDRVFAYALNGAVCFSNAADYLEGVFGRDGGVEFYSLRDLSVLGERIKALLAAPALLAAAGERAAATVRAGHTWRQRMISVLGAVSAARP